MQWIIGDVRVTRIEELLGLASRPPEMYLDGFDREVLSRHLDWLVPHHYAPTEDRFITSVHSWLIKTRHHTILLDSCAGNHKERPEFFRFHQLNTNYLTRLARAGVAPEDIDIVLCTHLHADHVGWNTSLRNGKWVPTFPNARYLFSKKENEIGDPRRNPCADRDLQRGRAYRDSVLPVIEAGQAELVDGDHTIDDDLSIRPTPGHTHGHIALQLANKFGRALFCGDAIHHALQVYVPRWNSKFCELPDAARATRLSMLEQCAEDRALLFPAHFGAPHVARIKKDDLGFSPEFIQPTHR